MTIRTFTIARASSGRRNASAGARLHLFIVGARRVACGRPVNGYYAEKVVGNLAEDVRLHGVEVNRVRDLVTCCDCNANNPHRDTIDARALALGI